MALTFTPDNRAWSAQYGCGLCGIISQNLHPYIDPETGQQPVIEYDPGMFYAQMEDDNETSRLEINEHIPQCEFNPNAPQKRIP